MVDMNHVCETKPEVPFTKPGVAVGVLVYQDGKLLFGKRLAKFGYGFYSIPGGKLEYGETIESAAARELEEETGLKAENFTLAGYTDDTWADRHWVTIYLETDTFHGEVKNPNQINVQVGNFTILRNCRIRCGLQLVSC
jgi:ADP-ribose pyrophosphatase YjhB (NUDIX family)